MRKMKYAIAFITCLVSAGVSKAQSFESPYAISLGAGITTTYGDLKKRISRPAVKLNFDRNITPYISAGFEAQAGNLASGSRTVSSESEGLYSQSSFFAANANFRFGLGQLLNMESRNSFNRFIGGFYIGGGIGLISAKIRSIDRVYPGPVLTGPVNGKVIDNNTGLAVPISIGMNFNFRSRLGLNINYQHTLTQGEALDGYDFSVASNNNNDAYSLLSLSLRYYIGEGYVRYR